MNEKELQFLGEMLINTSKGMKNFKDFSSMMQNCMTPADSAKLMDIFKPEIQQNKEKSESLAQLYNLDSFLKQYMKVLGYIPESELITVKEENQKLQDVIASKEAEIEKLNVALAQSTYVSDGTEIIKNLQNSMQNQGKEFQKMIQNICFLSKDDNIN